MSVSRFISLHRFHTALSLCAALALTGSLSSCSDSTTTPQPEQTLTSTAAESETPTPSPSPTQTPDTRATDFAVDPAKNQWNYESNGKKIVYLTFDDGPSHNTEKVLDILDEYDVKATFFVTGIMPDYAPWIKEAHSRGHTIGMHTYSHDYARVYASTDAYYADLDAISALVKEQIGYVPAFIRFPGGASNTISRTYTPGIMSALTADVQARGYQYYDWTASCGDGADHPADVIAAEATKWDAQDNIILLLHDSAAKDSTVQALPHIIEHYKNAGYTFEAIDRTTMVPHHGTNN